MARKITAILAAAVVLTWAGVASAQTNSHSARTVALGQSSEAVMLDEPVQRLQSFQPLN